ncbi:MAG: serine/threonine-protein kinase [Cyanobacteria bacterium P01_F01_bin.86]
MTCPQPPSPWIGCSIGDRQRYAIVECIAVGGMGDVFLATDTVLGQPVALKLLSNKLLSSEMRRRFEREVAVCAALRSDHIVQVMDFGVTSDGYPFYVMEYLEGQTLKQALQFEHRFAVERTIKIVTQICSGLFLAHQGIDLTHQTSGANEHVKVVHRDLKPGNIFLVPTGLGEFVKILDFGIAKICSPQAESTYATSMFLGTFQYAAPEQFRVEVTLDERADIYSLGMILYKMLTGTDPFGLKGQRTSFMTWAMAHTTQAPLSMREQPDCEHLPPELDAFVLSCIAKSPDHRPSSVTELEQRLHQIQAQVSDRQSDLPSTGQSPSQKTSKSGNDGPLFATTIQTLLTLPEDSQVPTKRYLPAEQSVSNQQGLKHLANRWQRLVLPLGVTSILAAGIGFYAVREAGLAALWGEPDVDQVGLTPSLTAPATELVPSAATMAMAKHANEVWAVATHPTDKLVASADADGTIHLRELQTGELVQALEGHSDVVRSLSFSQDGSLLVSGGGDKTIKIWDVATGSLVRTLTGDLGTIWSVDLSPDGQTIASGSFDGTIRLWNTQTGNIRQTLPEHYDSVWSVAISSDGRTLASGSYDSTIKIWDMQTGEIVRTLSGHIESIRTIAISPDGKTLVSGSWDKTIKVWDLSTGQLLHTLSGHTDRVLTVAINDAGTAIASGSIDQTVKIWDLQTGTESQTFSGHSGWVLSVAFGPDGKTVLSGSKDQTVRQWTIED